MTNDPNRSIYYAVPGGPDLVHWFGQVPSFHDAEILSLYLRRKGQSVLRLLGWITTSEVGQDGSLVLGKHAVVTFTLEDILDLQLEGFSVQNVIGGLVLRRAPDRPDRRNFLSARPLSEDSEIELEHCYGLSGLIRARSVSVTFEPARPDNLNA